MIAEKKYINDKYFLGDVTIKVYRVNTDYTDLIVIVDYTNYPEHDMCSYEWFVDVDIASTNTDEILTELKKDKYHYRGSSCTI